MACEWDARAVCGAVQAGSDVAAVWAEAPEQVQAPLPQRSSG